MFITHIKYSQYSGTVREWALVDFMPGQINLMVGKNATGKTRSLNLIGTLAHLISGERSDIPEHADYEVHFLDEDDCEFLYNLSFREHQVRDEILQMDGKMMFERHHGDDCQLYFEELKQHLHVNVPSNILGVVSRRDPIQHSFFEKLYQWGRGTLHYRFGTLMGKNYGMLILPEDKHQANVSDEEIDLHKTDRVVENFEKGLRNYDTTFTEAIIADMKKLQYDISEIGIDYSPRSHFMHDTQPPAVLRVKEVELCCHTYQSEMSQGMFRALSLIIQINLSRLRNTSESFIIDDIGEGLDFERSTGLIKLLIRKVEGSRLQLYMSTNDRFVMNNVGLKYWSVIQRKGNKSKVFNKLNATEAFDAFAFTGLNNFDFLCTEFYCHQPELE